MDNPFKPPALLSVCTGKRGLEIGIERAVRALWDAQGIKGREGINPFRPAAFVEIESVVAYNLVAQMEQGVLASTPVWTNLKTFPWELFRNKIFLLAGGYPCTPFSTAGKQFGALDPRHLYPYLEHGIRTIGPVCCCFENVSNHLNIGYREVRHSLETLGYTVEEGIFSAEEVGAPHLRKRLFILAVANAYCTEQSKRRGDLRKMLGLQEGQCQSEQRPVVSGGGSSELDNTHNKRESECKRSDSNITGRFNDTSEGMGNPEQQGSQRINGLQEPTIITKSSEGVGHADSFSTGLAQREEQSTREEQQTFKRSGGIDRWPAPQGREQYEWEDPRLVSRLDFTVNGFDFTEDLLRMAGNAVVEQQAELAFRTLIQKFI